MISGYKISSETSDMDISVIHGYIARSYWAENIPLNTMEMAINNSLCFGVFTDSGNQVAFARMITDTATFAYLADVFVLEEHRGKGISKWIMKNIIEHPKLQGIRRMALATSDAHGLYEQFGFKALSSPKSFMELHHPEVYK
ncbi:GNAT family N-acetyltransferase [Colwellia sp. 4_MG-2023]|uniref:GNAT family N-acetyltransferase n=1 Tax=unclassified Colwellia TaxID=196834 RepID=UPI0026E340C1|nr:MULTISPECIES: GNAT family N-acetyltransferase [unclassified Colwellia]MDO6507986.1 GNAT family N-acetyltransferase [Colwellia sp. 5_MG-2023]MDO6556286.1 GNAT family N-acetyltransferase [Colwellia sp. 4_MG-2023]